jgi:hypothetical protein
MLTGFAASHISSYITKNSRPPIVASNEFVHLVLARVSRYRRIMMLPNDLSPQLLVNWHIDSTVPGDDAVMLSPSFSLGI